MPVRTASSGSVSVSPTQCTATAPAPATAATATPTTATLLAATPAVTRLSIVAHTASASALPDRFEAAVSRRGGVVALWSAATLCLLQTSHLPRLWARTLQVRRKPVAVAVTDDGALLAVLARPAQVDIYELSGGLSKRRTIALLHEATALSLSPDARILVAGNRLGIEVVAMGPDSPDTARRTLSGPPGHALEFADDGRTLLITAAARAAHSSALVVLPGLYDGPLGDDGEPQPQPLETAWTASVLFPAPARPAHQAALLPDPATGTVHELLAFNTAEHAWGIFDVATQRFTPPTLRLPDEESDSDVDPDSFAEPAHDALPAVSPLADLAAIAVRQQNTTSIAIYALPGGGIDAERGHSSSEKAAHDASVPPRFCIPVPHHKNDDDTTIHEICILRWVRLDAHVQRLVAVGHSRTLPDASDVPGAPPAAKALLLVLDFDAQRPPDSSAPEPVAVEYDIDWMLPGEALPEGSIDFDREVELVRTRTLAQRRAAHEGADSATTKPSRRTATVSRPSHRPRLPSGGSEELTPEEAQALFEAPYDHQQPRSQVLLARAATVAAGSSANRQHLRALPLRPLDYHRADGHRQPPHESDADNWVPPPPAYTPIADGAGSVSLSHPDAPPIPRSSRSVNRPSVPPVPPVPDLSATVDPAQLSSSMPYQVPQLSNSSNNVNHHPTREWEQEYRPSLLHPSTYPGPQSQPQPLTPSNRSRRSSSVSRVPSPPASYMAGSMSHPANAPYAPPRPPIPGQRRDMAGAANPPFFPAATTPTPTPTPPYAYNATPHAPSQAHHYPFPHQHQHQQHQQHAHSYTLSFSSSSSSSTTTPHLPHTLRSLPFTQSQPHLLAGHGNGNGNSSTSSSRLDTTRRDFVEATAFGGNSSSSSKKKKAECALM